MRKRNVIALSILATVITVLLFYQTPLMAHARSTAWDVWVHSIARLFRLGMIDAEPSITKQLEQLRAENVRLRAQLQDYARIQQQLGSPSFESMRAIPAAVVSRPLDTFRSQYVINKGVKDGVSTGAPVVMNGSVLVGLVTGLNNHSATIQSLFHPSTHLTVETVSEDKETPPARGLLRSKYYTSLIIATVPRDVRLEVGQPVVTVHKDTRIPYGLVIGSISDVTSEEHEAYQEARLSVPYDIDMLDAVHVLVPP